MRNAGAPELPRLTHIGMLLLFAPLTARRENVAAAASTGRHALPRARHFDRPCAAPGPEVG